MNGPVCVVGAGTMGAGIALCLAQVAEVRLVARRPASLEAAAARIGRSGALLREHGLGCPDAPARISYTTSLREGAVDCALVLESIIEDLEAKRALLAELEQLAGPEALLATNTSSLPIDELAAALRSPERFGGLHWLNPAEFVELVELVPGSATSPDARAALRAWAEAAGKTAVEVRRDVPGFVVNRLQYALLREAFALVESGVCGVRDVDVVLRVGLGARWAAVGPFEGLDLAGLDIYAAVAARLYPELSCAREPAGAARALVEAGVLGCKSGRGLYGDWSEDAIATRVRGRDELLLALAAARGTTGAAAS